MPVYPTCVFDVLHIVIRMHIFNIDCSYMYPSCICLFHWLLSIVGELVHALLLVRVLELVLVLVRVLVFVLVLVLVLVLVRIIVLVHAPVLVLALGLVCPCIHCLTRLNGR